MEDKDLSELIDDWKEHENAYNFEGTSGVRKLQRLCEVLGYREGHFFGSEVSIENFLADNPGAIEAIVNWIEDMDLDEWKEAIIDQLPEEDEEETDEA